MYMRKVVSSGARLCENESYPYTVFDSSESVGREEEECNVMVESGEGSGISTATSTLRDLRYSLSSCAELPRLPPVKLRSFGKNAEQQQLQDEDSPSVTGSFFDGQEETSPSGEVISLRNNCNRLSVSQGIVEDDPLIDGDEDESAIDNGWCSDTYEDDNDPGYHRQPIEDQAWFLAEEIDYPSEDERAKATSVTADVDADVDFSERSVVSEANVDYSPPSQNSCESFRDGEVNGGFGVSFPSPSPSPSPSIDEEWNAIQKKKKKNRLRSCIAAPDHQEHHHQYHHHAADEEEEEEEEEEDSMQNQLQAEEDEYETFNLRIIHRKNRTGFEEGKEFPVVINSIIAGRYKVTEYLGAAAFSKAIQAHDLHTGMDVCMKIIKNNKDFFDQSLDEIKLLKYINKHDPSDKYHILRIYDYFYHREHLFIVCELLRANLYEFHKYNRESGGEVYFTMPRLQLITRQCLEALEFLHGIGLMHCDLKPENILIKSYSRCEVKVIDLGSSCFKTDNLSPYVQSRSYRAPEVILGHSYDQRIDIWSLGCILAELCSGNVLFENESLGTLLARVVGILGGIDPEMLAKGRDTYKYFTKNHVLYERNRDSEQLEYLIPKKTRLSHRLAMGDKGFVEFVGYLLQINPKHRPSASQALKHPWLSFPYDHTLIIS